MSRFSVYKLAASERARDHETLSRLLARMESADEIRLLITDLLSASETTMLVRRLKVASLLAGGTPRKDVVKDMKCGDVLVGEIAYRLVRGGDGFLEAIKKLDVVRNEMAVEISFADKSENPATPEGMARRSPNVFWGVHASLAAPREIRNIAAGRKRKKNMQKEKPR